MKGKNRFILAIILFGLVLRLIGIKWGLPDKNHFYPYYCDEYNPVYVLGNMEPLKLDFNPRYLHNPTFFYYLVGATWGLGHISGLLTITKDKDFYLRNPHEYGNLYLSGRFLVIGFSLLSIYMVYLLGKKLFSETTGIISALFLSVVPLHVFQSHFMEISIVSSFFVLLAMYFAVLALETNEKKYYIISGIVTGLAMGTKYTTWPFLFVFIICDFIYRKKFNKKILSYIVCSVLFFLMTTPYAILDFHRFQLDFLHKLPRGIPNFSIPLKLLWYSLTPHILLLSILGIFYSIVKLKEKPNILPMLLWILLYYFFTSAKALPVARYQCEYLHFLIILASSNFELKAKKFFKYVIVAICFSWTIYSTISYLKLFLATPPQDQASQWIIENIPEKATIGVLFRPYWYSPPVINMQYYTIPRSDESDEMTYSHRRYDRRYLKYPEYIIVNLKDSLHKLLEVNPEYIIVSEWEEHRSEIINLVKKKYNQIKFFKNSKLSVNHFDFQVIDMGIKIYKKI